MSNNQRFKVYAVSCDHPFVIDESKKEEFLSIKPEEEAKARMQSTLDKVQIRNEVPELKLQRSFKPLKQNKK